MLNKRFHWPEQSSLSIHYRFWGKPGTEMGFTTPRRFFQTLFRRNPALVSFLADMEEILDWADSELNRRAFRWTFLLHVLSNCMRSTETYIKAALGMATFQTLARPALAATFF